MWHEARRQEKLIRSQMIDNVKRNERRKQFYENVRKDPEQFMQVHGRKCQIHMDPAVARAAEASSILCAFDISNLLIFLFKAYFSSWRRWQGDPSILIDRFDVRAHMDHISEKKVDNYEKQHKSLDDVEELQCEYERYRILVLNEFDRVSEKTFLKEIAAKEFWPDESNSSSAARAEQEKKKSLRDKKAAVGFTYDDTQTVQCGIAETDESEDDDDFVDSDEFDFKLDLDTLDAEQRRNLNKLGVRYGINSGAFSSLLKMDRREQDETHQLKEIEKAKLALAGRQAKAERAVLKKKRALIVGKGCLNEEATTTLLSFVTKSEKDNLETSSSTSTEDDEGRTEFITTFGGDGVESKDAEREEDDDDQPKVLGPTLPSAEFRRIFELKTRRSSSPEDYGNVSKNCIQSRSPASRRPLRSRSRERIARSKSRERSRRSKSRERRDDSRSSSVIKRRRNNSNREKRRSSSRDKRLDNSRARNRDKRREEFKIRLSRRKSTSSNESAHSRSRIYHSRKKRTGQKVDVDSSKRSSDKKSRKHRRRHSSSSDPNHSLPPVSEKKATNSVSSPKRSDGDTSPLAIHSSMSESEKERIEVENRRRRIRRTAKQHRQQYGSNYDRLSEDEAERKAALAHKLRSQMQKTLRKTAEQLKEEQRQKHEEHEKERRVKAFVLFLLREERLFEESLEMRRREREKRRRERRDRSISSSCSSS
ncbi:unnamed protein product [Thelazia callipaeda]|uniref:DRY_EERY domain-containing protein n=1 Tax=Thelazia callipaeda TaxID=103827 RepID=A0A158RC22_THECL|nr:unnamed protein product [Thelazia callipaeda]